jgi:tRNA (guanine-N7-)-methyltransferase
MHGQRHTVTLAAPLMQMADFHGKKLPLLTASKKLLVKELPYLEHQEWRFYGRRIGRKLNKTRQAALEKLHPALSMPELNKDGALAPASLFKNKSDKTILEIGFGNGEHLAEMMRRTPDCNFIGAEPFINGMTAFLKEIDDDDSLKLNNIRIHMDDAIPLVKSLTPNSIDALYVLNPDPWHKTRHHQRRIINQDNLTEFSRVLKSGGTLIMTTDVIDLIEWMVTEASLHPDFEWTAECADDWRKPPEDWIPTRYESKGAKGSDHMNYLFFVRK